MTSVFSPIVAMLEVKGENLCSPFVNEEGEVFVVEQHGEINTVVEG